MLGLFADPTKGNTSTATTTIPAKATTTRPICLAREIPGRYVVNGPSCVRGYSSTITWFIRTVPIVLAGTAIALDSPESPA